MFLSTIVKYYLIFTNLVLYFRNLQNCVSKTNQANRILDVNSLTIMFNFEFKGGEGMS